jgi:hypothetical protein
MHACLHTMLFRCGIHRTSLSSLHAGTEKLKYCSLMTCSYDGMIKFSKCDVERVSAVLRIRKLIAPFLQVQSDQCPHLPHCGERLRWRVPLCLFCCQAPAIPGGSAQGGQKVHRSDSSPLLPPCIPSLSGSQYCSLCTMGVHEVYVNHDACADCLACAVKDLAQGDRRWPPSLLAPHHNLLHHTSWHNASTFLDASAFLDLIV